MLVLLRHDVKTHFGIQMCKTTEVRTYNRIGLIFVREDIKWCYATKYLRK